MGLTKKSVSLPDINFISWESGQISKVITCPWIYPVRLAPLPGDSSKLFNGVNLRYVHANIRYRLYTFFVVFP